MDRHLELSSPAPVWPHVPEETANGATHAVGLLLSVAGASVLVATACLYGNAWHVLGCGVYAATLVAVYAASTLSHLVERPRPRHIFRVLDQAFIYLLIAGTYTPFALVYLRSGWWWLLSAAVWSFALGGFLSKTVWRHRIDAIAVWMYVALGWLPYLAIEKVVRQLPFEVFWWLLIGGLCYLVGVIFLKLDRKVPYFHAAWHVIVIAGSFCHYVAIFHYVLPFRA